MFSVSYTFSIDLCACGSTHIGALQMKIQFISSKNTSQDYLNGLFCICCALWDLRFQCLGEVMVNLKPHLIKPHSPKYDKTLLEKLINAEHIEGLVTEKLQL